MSHRHNVNKYIYIQFQFPKLLKYIWGLFPELEVSVVIIQYQIEQNERRSIEKTEVSRTNLLII